MTVSAPYYGENTVMRTPPPDLPSLLLKERIGTVVSDKMDKTVVVAVINRYPHPTYKKIVSRTTRYKAHDPDNTCVLGDLVKIRETRPLSAHKRWAIEEILNKTSQAKEVKK